ncbi:MAG: hypothetical protein K6E83_00140 [Clostridium sp.]|nr:hypothetical protein [Clostridium sp.]
MARQSFSRSFPRRPRCGAAVFLLAVLMFCLQLSAPALANAPVPRYFFTVTVENPPEGSWGVDFLAPKDRIPVEEYTDCNAKALENAKIPEDCELVSLDADGYVSYLCHDVNGEFTGELSHTGSGTDPAAESGEDASGAAGLTVVGYNTGYHFLTGKDVTDVRLAVIDREGNVLALSEPFEVYKSTPYIYYGEITFDAASGKAQTILPEKDGEPVDPNDPRERSIVFFIFTAIFLMTVVALITMLLEFLLALAFRMRPAGWTLLVNLCSNLSFNFLLLVFCLLPENPVPYWGFVFAGEVAVIVIEYLVYRGIYGKVASNGRILAYTVTANLVSALFVIFLAAVLAP